MFEDLDLNTLIHYLLAEIIPIAVLSLIGALSSIWMVKKYKVSQAEKLQQELREKEIKKIAEGRHNEVKDDE